MNSNKDDVNNRDNPGSGVRFMEETVGARREQGHRRARLQEPRQLPYQQLNVQQKTPTCTDFDAAYFNFYAHLGIHEEMIKDRVRTDAYKAVIMCHKSYIKGKVVLDVGCGTGILSFFCAQAGAKRLFALQAEN